MMSLPVFCSSSLVANDQSMDPPDSSIREAGDADLMESKQVNKTITVDAGAT